MEEGLKLVLKIVFLVFVAIVIIGTIYIMKDKMYELLNSAKEIFSNLFKFS